MPQPVVTNPGGGIIERETHLRNVAKLFKRTEPPLWNVRQARAMLTPYLDTASSAISFL
jgi:hypothetical protein